MDRTTEEACYLCNLSRGKSPLPNGMQPDSKGSKKALQLLDRYSAYGTFKRLARNTACLLSKLTDECLREGYNEALRDFNLSSAQVCLNLLNSKGKMLSETVLRDCTNENKSSTLPKMTVVPDSSSTEIGSSMNRQPLERSLKQSKNSRLECFQFLVGHRSTCLESIEEFKSPSDSKSEPSRKCSDKSNKGDSVDSTRRIKSTKSIQSKTQPLKYPKCPEQSESEDSEDLFRPSTSKRIYPPTKAKSSRPTKIVKQNQETEKSESETSAHQHQLVSKYNKAEKHLDKSRSKRHHYGRRQSDTDEDSSSNYDNDSDVKRRNQKEASLSHNRKRGIKKIGSSKNDTSSRAARLDKSRSKRNHYGRRQSDTDEDSTSDEGSTSNYDNDSDVERRNQKEVSFSHSRKRGIKKIGSSKNDTSSRAVRLNKSRSKRNHYGRRQSDTDEDSTSDEGSTSNYDNDSDVERRNQKEASFSHNRKRAIKKIISSKNDTSSRATRTERSRLKTKVNYSCISPGSSISPEPCPKTNLKKHVRRPAYTDSEDNVKVGSSNQSSKNLKKPLSTSQSTNAKKSRKACAQNRPSSKTQSGSSATKNRSKKTPEASKKSPRPLQDIPNKAIVNNSQFMNCLKELESSFLKGKPDPLAASKSNKIKRDQVKAPSISQTSQIKKGSKVTNKKCSSSSKPSDKKKRKSLAKVKQATKPRSKHIKKTGAVKNPSDDKTKKPPAQKKKLESKKPEVQKKEVKPKAQKKQVKPKEKKNTNKKITKGNNGTAKSTEKDTKEDGGTEKSCMEEENGQKNTSLSSDESFLSDPELEPKLGSLSSCLNSIKRKVPRPLGSATPPLSVFLSATNDGCLSEASETSSFDRIPTKLDDKNVVKRMARANKPNHKDAPTSQLTSSESKQILKTPQSLKQIMKIEGKVKSQDTDLECSSFSDD